MYGRYTKELGACAKDIKIGLNRKYKEDAFRGSELHKYRGKCASKILNGIGFIWRHSFAKLGEDWVFLALLGFFMAILSFFVDYGISFINEGKVFSLFLLNLNDLAKLPKLQSHITIDIRRNNWTKIEEKFIYSYINKNVGKFLMNNHYLIYQISYLSV